MTGYPRLGRIAVDAGTVDVRHRLALAVEPVDAATGRPVGEVQVGRETSRRAGTLARPRRGRGPLDPRIRFQPVSPGGAPGRFVVRHDGTVTDTVRVRVSDAGGRWVPRRFEVPVWTLAEVEACDPTPGADAATGPFIPAISRLFRPWVLPGSAYRVAPRATGARLRITRAGRAVRWPRVEVFDTTGRRFAWAHGDAGGEVLVLVPVEFDSNAERPVDVVHVAVRVHAAPPPEADDVTPPGATPAGYPPHPRDRLHDLPVEQVPHPPAPPAPPQLVDDIVRGITPPDGYVSAPDDTHVELTVGQLVAPPAIAIP